MWLGLGYIPYVWVLGPLGFQLHMALEKTEIGFCSAKVHGGRRRVDEYRGLDNYQCHFHVQLRYSILQPYEEYGTIILVTYS